jgi:DNA-binding transcriptional LysR family regulator
MNEWAEFRHIRYLLEILKQRGVRPAAESLHTSAPNLCMQANQFQEHFHIRLYEKGIDNRFVPTEAGEAFLVMAPGLFDALDDFIAALIAIDKGELCTLRLGSGTFVDEELFRAACELHKQFLPSCTIRPSHADTTQLISEIASGEIDAALVTLPAEHSELCVEELKRDRLVACLRADHPLAERAAVRPSDLQDHLRVLYHKQRHPEAHAKLMEQLREVGVRVGDYSGASHPSEMQRLVKDGYGLTLMREGTVLDPELTTRPIQGVDWTVDTAFVYHKERHPKSIPVLVRHLKRRYSASLHNTDSAVISIKGRTKNIGRKRPLRSEDNGPEQLWLLG